MHNRRFIILAAMLTASIAQAETKFTAADVPHKFAPKGRIVIRNDSRSITAFRFFADVKEAIFSLRASRSLARRAYGSVLYQSDARATRVPPYFSAYVAEAARQHGVDPRLLAAVAGRESAWNPNATSPVGACGLMQLMPATARYLGVNNVYDARENILGGARYLRTLLDTFGGDLDLTLAAYNAGPGAVAKYNGVPPFRETLHYVTTVRTAYEKSLGSN